MFFGVIRTRFYKYNSNISIRLRKASSKNTPTVAQVTDKNFVNELMNNDEAYKIMENIQGSHGWLVKVGKKGNAMIRQFGVPSIFLTLSANEKNWTELHQILIEIEQLNGAVPDEINSAYINKLLNKDPATCAQYFEYRFRKY